MYCLSCLTSSISSTRKFCDNKCQADYRYIVFIKQWKQGKVTGSRGITVKGLSGHIRRYLFSKYPPECSICKWSQVNQITGKIPLEIDHIDGNAENNQESNLRIVCPNCHALTFSYRNLNKGNGRKWRRLKYRKNE